MRLFEVGTGVVLALAVLFAVGRSVQRAGARADQVPIVAWSGQGPQLDAAGQFSWVPVPGMVRRRPAGVIRVTMAGPYPAGAWTQHGGAIATLQREIPAGTPFTVRFAARTVSGAQYLSVLRRWGGSEPIQHVTLTPEWTRYTVRRTTPDFPTHALTFSLAPRSSGLHTLAEGTFELRAVRVTLASPAAHP